MKVWMMSSDCGNYLATKLTLKCLDILKRQ